MSASSLYGLVETSDDPSFIDTMEQVYQILVQPERSLADLRVLHSYFMKENNFMKRIN
jgi:hypothetical protein